MRVKHFFEKSATEIAFIISVETILFFLLPLFASFLPNINTNVKTFSLNLINKSYIAKVAFRTIYISFFSTLLALILGMCFAYFTANRFFWGRKFLLSLSVIPLCVPPLIIALAFVSAFGMNGFVNRFFMQLLKLRKPPITFLYSSVGIIIAQGFYNFPLIMKIISDNWEELSVEEENAARMLSASEAKIFFTITFYKLVPAILSACIPVFLYCFFSFMIVLLFANGGTSTLEAEIYRSAKITLNHTNAIILSAIETFCAFLVITIYSIVKKYSLPIKSRTIKKNAKVKIASSYYQSKSAKKIEYTVFVLLTMLFIVFLVLPFLLLFINAIFQKNNFLHFIFSKTFLTSVLHTLLVSPVSAFFCVTSATVYACFLRIQKNLSKKLFFQLIPLMPLAVSSVVVGFGCIRLNLSPNIFTLILLQSSLSWPFAFRIIFAKLQMLSNSVIECATLLSASPLDPVFNIFIPFAKKSIASSFGFCLAISAGDATLPLMLSIPKFTPLSLYTYRLALSYRFNQSCIAGAILCCICMLFFWIGKIYDE
ncbi:MAG: iron ABC transporter permease [Treponema sp.]|nr:iron ABC transporter permease [Treponema sp.]